MRITPKIIEDRLKELVGYKKDEGSVENVCVTRNRYVWTIEVVFSGGIWLNDINTVNNSYIEKILTEFDISSSCSASISSIDDKTILQRVFYA